MKVKIDLENLACDLMDVDLVELSMLHDALATYVETLYPEVAAALQEGTPLDDALEGVDESDAFKVRTIVERLYDKLDRPLGILEEETERQAVMEVGDRVRILLDSADEATMLHEAARELGDQVGRALEASDIPYPDAEGLVREFASWFDPDDIPEYPYFIEMEVADARIIAQLAERVNAHQPTDKMAQLLKVMQAASEADGDDGEDADEAE
ncbi:MAG TPA: hypothetical protein V6D00_02350 [Pantanalinema sp.]